MAKEDILLKIKSDFEKEAGRIRKETESKIRNLAEETDGKISSEKEEIFKQLHQRVEEIKRKKYIETDIKNRNLLLAGKQEVVDSVFQEVENKIKEPDKNGYRLLMEKMILSAVREGDAEIVFSKEDREIFGNDFIAGINNKTKSLGKKGNISISKEYGSFSGGFILKYKGIEINITFETIFKQLRQDLEMDVGKILFN